MNPWIIWIIYTSLVAVGIVAFWWAFRIGGLVDRRQMRDAMEQGRKDVKARIPMSEIRKRGPRGY